MSTSCSSPDLKSIGSYAKCSGRNFANQVTKNKNSIVFKYPYVYDFGNRYRIKKYLTFMNNYLKLLYTYLQSVKSLMSKKIVITINTFGILKHETYNKSV